MSGFNFLKPPASSAAPAGGLFGGTTQPAGGLFGNTGAQQQNPPAGGLFGSVGGQQQTQPQTGLFGASTSQPQNQQPAGLFGATGGMFGNANQQNQQPNNLFGLNAKQPPNSQSTGLFSGTPAKINLLNPGNGLNASSNTASSRAQIDIEHIRPTTKFDALTPALQSEIEALEKHIGEEISKCSELTSAMPSIIASGREVPLSYDFVKDKSDALAIALENDAAEIVELKDRIIKRDLAEARLCWKSIDRLKMPAQYQNHGHHGVGTGNEAVYGGSGLSGWWNNPTISTRTRHGGQKKVLSVDAEDDLEVAGGTLVDLLNGRVDEMAGMLKENKSLLAEIEGFVGNVEGKILMREREVIDGSVGGVGEKERQIKMLRYVFGEVERSLYEVAERVGESRDALMELGEQSAAARLAF